MQSLTTKEDRHADTRRYEPEVNGQGGFTIIETVIAMCIAMVVGFGAISLFIFSIGYNAGASDRARALAYAQQRMEVLRATTYSSLSTVAAGSDFNGTVAVGSPNNPDYDQRSLVVSTTVADDPNVQNSHQKIITVSVTPPNAGRWTGGGVTLRCFRSENAIGAN